MKNRNINTEYTNEIVCPFCGYEIVGTTPKLKEKAKKMKGKNCPSCGNAKMK